MRLKHKFNKDEAQEVERLRAQDCLWHHPRKMRTKYLPLVDLSMLSLVSPATCCIVVQDILDII